MKRNWIVLVFALLALASCSVEKRVYQPGYHIEWNLFAEQGRSEDASKDAAQDAALVVSQDLTQDLPKNLETATSQDLSQDLSKNLEIVASQQDDSKDAAQAAGVTKEKLQQIIQTVSPVQTEDVLADTKSYQTIDSDLETILLILLALFLPALTIFILEGFSKNFWIALLLMILAFSLPVPLFLQLLIQGLATVLAIAVVLHYM
jgi:uncharacterized membrane protein YqaE (UPF0057 family)